MVRLGSLDLVVVAFMSLAVRARVWIRLEPTLLFLIFPRLITEAGVTVSTPLEGELPVCLGHRTKAGLPGQAIVF